jgi:hypothetical protein
MKRMLVALLAAMAAVAHAGDWSFTLKDLRSDGIFGSAGSLISVSGSFSGADANGDGFITTDELTNVYVWETFQAYPFRHVGLDETTRPYDTGFASIRFEVATGQLLELGAGSFDGATGYRMSLNGAFQCSHFCFGATFEEGTSSVVVTTLPAPVPEPSTYLLMALGLLALPATARWRG